MKKWIILFLSAGILYGEVDYLNMGLVAHQKGLYNLSNTQLEKYIQQNPDGQYLDYAYLLYAKNLINLGKFEESKEKLTFLIENFPQSQYLKDAYTYTILVCLELSELNTSLEFYNVYIKKWGENKEIENQVCGKLIQRGIDSFQKGNYKKAIKCFNEVLTISNDTSFLDIANYYTALIYYQKNDFSKAKELFLKIKGENSKILPDVYLKIGDCYLNLKDYNEAKRYYEKVVSTYPETETANWAMYQIAVIKKKEGKLNEGELILNRIKTNDNDLKLQILQTLSEIYILEEKWTDAEKTILEIFQQFPSEKNPANYIKLAFINFNMKNMENSISYFNSALNLNPSDELKEKIYFGLGYTYYLNGDIEKSFSFWEKIEKQFPESSFLPEIYYIKGKKYFDMKEFTKSEKYLKNLVENYKESSFITQAIPLLIQIYIEEGNYKKAEEICQEVKNKNEEINFLYGKTLYLTKEYEKAKYIFETTDIKNPQFKVESLYYLAQIYLYEGKEEKGKEKLLEIVTYYPQFKEFYEKAEKQLKKYEK
ncbi:MAG TPA: tetratricopeptide repeat protein [bacterium]|nr:tetratricopeptide repeat protein [bacterium]